MKRHLFTALLAFGTVCAAVHPQMLYAQQKLPNFVIIYADDLGYGDLTCYGHPTIKTPHLDQMAEQGMRFTQFYSAANVCTPSRAALMTGRYPIRNGMCGDKWVVLFPGSKGGIQDSEITLAQALKTKGYATACVGKWHLGHLPQYLPMRHGFDYYFGIPYSNDMKPSSLMRNDDVIEDPAVQETLTIRYTDEVVRFIKQNKDKPFFVYMPHTFPHVPLHASERFKGKSLRGLYGDVVSEVDWSVGKILGTLQEQGLAENTLVMFSSDNGPWLIQNQRGGSAGLLREGKGSTWEGGHREPFIAWWPGKIKPAIERQEVASTLDIFPTVLTLAGIPLPQDRVLDGRDLSSVLLEHKNREIKPFFYYNGTKLMAVRKGPWKAHLFTYSIYARNTKPVKHDPPLLYQLENDPSEKYDVAKDHPEVIADLLEEIKNHQATIEPVKSQLDG